ncbi:MAG: hypothetical protein KF774_03600 [Planctomyces sp.]|nr:hypothetical protein [Planctomyces sp.]
MTRIRCAAAFLALVAVGASALAADGPLNQFASDTDVVVRFKTPKATIEKVARMVDKIQPGFGAMVRQNSPAIGMLISNPALTGVDQTKDWYIAIHTNGPDQPSVVFAIPTTNAKAADAALGEQFSSHAAGGWLYYSEDEDALPGDSAPVQALAGVMRGEPTTLFERGDISIFVNIANLTTKYADELEQAQEQAAMAIQQIGEQAPPTPGMDIGALLNAYSEIFNHLIRGAQDTQQLTIAATIADDGILFEDYLSFTSGSSTANALRNHPRNAMAGLTKLPADATVLFGASADMQQLTAWGMSFSSSMLGDNQDLKAQLDTFNTGIKSITFGPMIGSFSLGNPADGMFRTVSVMEVSPVEKYRDMMRSLSESMGRVEMNGITQETTVQRDAESVGSDKVDIVTVVQDFDENLDPTGMQKQMQGVMFGPEGLATRMLYQKGRVVSSLGGGKAALEAAVRNLDGTASGQIEAGRKGMIDDPNLLVLIDLPGLAMQGIKAASEIPGLPLPIDGQAVDNLKLPQSYIGFSAAVEPDAVRIKTRIPVEQAQSLIAIGFFFQQMQGGGGF